jgi:hypothetical protein
MRPPKIGTIIKMVSPYRIIKKDGKVLNAGTDKPSWFNLDNARKTVNRENGEKIIESDGVNDLWEVF